MLDVYFSRVCGGWRRARGALRLFPPRSCAPSPALIYPRQKLGAHFNFRRINKSYKINILHFKTLLFKGAFVLSSSSAQLKL